MHIRWANHSGQDAHHQHRQQLQYQPGRLLRSIHCNLYRLSRIRGQGQKARCRQWPLRAVEYNRHPQWHNDELEKVRQRASCY